MSFGNNDDNDERRAARKKDGSGNNRRIALGRWLGGMGLLGLAALNLQNTLGANAAAVADAQQQAAAQAGGGEPAPVPSSGMGLDLSPMPLNEALRAAEREGVSKFGKKVLFDAATEMPGSGVTSNGVKYTTKV